MNSLEHVRETMEVTKTENKMTLKIEVNAYLNNDFLNVNGAPKNDPERKGDWLAASRFITQMVEEFRNQVLKELRNRQEAA